MGVENKIKRSSERFKIIFNCSFLDTPFLDTPFLDTPFLDTPFLDTPFLDTPFLDSLRFGLCPIFQNYMCTQ